MRSRLTLDRIGMACLAESPAISKQDEALKLPLPFVGVVSLLEMLDFAAEKYVELAHQFGLFMASLGGHKPDPDHFGLTYHRLLEDCKKLGLPVTHQLIGQLVLEAVKSGPARFRLEKREPILRGEMEISKERLCHHIESIYSSMKAELGSIAFRA